MGALARLRRSMRRRTRALPRRGRKVVRVATTLAQAGAAARLARGGREERAIALLAVATRRSPDLQRVVRANVQLLSRTGRISAAVVAASQVVVQGASKRPQPASQRLQRVVQGRWVETDPIWRPVVPGPAPAAYEPVPGRVLYLAKESMPHRNNGYCTRTHETLLAVRAAGRDPVAVTVPGFGAGTSSLVDGIEYHHVLPDAQRLLSGLTGEEYVQLTTSAFARELLRVRPAVLHAGSGHRGFDLALPGLALAEWARLPWIYEVRSFFETTWTSDERYAENAEYYHRRFGAESRVMRAADVVVTLSGPMRDEIVSAHGVDPGSVFVVPNAVDLERFVPDRAEQRRDDEKRGALGLLGKHELDTFVLGYVSNLDHHREGQEVLLRAAARLRSRGVAVSVLLVGDGRRRAELEELAGQLRLGGACVFAGSVPFDEIPAWYAQIDLFVVPRVAERAARMVSPMKPFEAMAMRVPVLVSDLPALVEIAGAGEERAFVFPAGDADALAVRVEQLVASPELLRGRAEAAERWVRAERTWAANGKAFDEIYGLAAERAALAGRSGRARSC